MISWCVPSILALVRKLRLLRFLRRYRRLDPLQPHLCVRSALVKAPVVPRWLVRSDLAAARAKPHVGILPTLEQLKAGPFAQRAIASPVQRFCRRVLGVFQQRRYGRKEFLQPEGLTDGVLPLIVPEAVQIPAVALAFHELVLRGPYLLRVADPQALPPVQP